MMHGPRNRRINDRHLIRRRRPGEIEGRSGAMTGEQREAPSMVTLPNQSEIEPRFAPGSSAAGTRF